MRRALLAVLVATLAGGLPACSKRHHDAKPAPAPDTSTTTAPDLGAVALRPVPGTTTSTLPGTPGAALLKGRVLDSAGQPVAGASVRAEWFVFAAATPVETQSALDGTYQLAGLHGGRWRVRAWRPPDVASGELATLFLGATDQRDLDLHVREVNGPAVTASIAPNPPPVKRDAELAVLVNAQSVDSDGRVVRTPLPDIEVTLAGSGRWSIVSGSSTKLTDSSGVARYRLRCQEAGPQPLSVYISGKQYDLAVPDCAPEEVTTTSGSSAPTTAPGGTTTTTRLLSTTTSSSTTTTTRRGGG